jgi:uncharacterized membrane protein YhfC
MLTVAHILNFAIMIALPLALGAWMKRRFALSWVLFGWGALTFLASQALHIPFNQFLLAPWVTGLGFPGSASGLVIGSLLLGLSAGVFEELARYLFLRRWARSARSWQSGLLYGAGHGGVEAVLLGLLALIGFVQAVALRQADLAQVLDPGDVALAQQQLQAYWTMPPAVALLGAVERVFALVVQMSAALMVVAAVVREQKRWLLAAILWHAFVDALAVYLLQRVGVFPTELALSLLALCAGAFIFWARSSGLLPLHDRITRGPDGLRPGSSRVQNHAQQDQISEELDRSRYL